MLRVACKLVDQLIESLEPYGPEFEKEIGELNDMRKVFTDSANVDLYNAKIAY
jgi:hypothetical protein